MEARDPELKKELHATLHTRRDLGEEYDAALVESFLEKVEQSIDATVDRRVRRRLAEQQMTAARGGRTGPQPLDAWGERFGFALLSLILAIPLSAIAVVNAGLLGLLTAWAGIIGVNAVHSRRTFPGLGRDTRDRHERDTDWTG